MKHPVMLYLSSEELHKLWTLVAASPEELWADSNEDGPYEQLLIHTQRLQSEVSL